MAVTLVDLTRDVLDSVYSYVQVKDRVLYLNADIGDSDPTLVLDSSTAARQIQEGQILQLSWVAASAQSELVRVRSVNTATNTVTIVRGVLGSTASAWAASTTEIRIDPEYPLNSIVREINREITGLPPHIWSYVTSTTTVNTVLDRGYTLPAGAKAVQSVSYQPSGTDDSWESVRRYKFDPVNNLVQVFSVMEPGRPLKIVYRAYPTALAADGNDLVNDAGLEESLSELIILGATYRLVMKRASGRLVDTRAETPMNQQYRQADPVMSAVRQLYAMYQERLAAERERQRLLWPSPLYYTM